MYSATRVVNRDTQLQYFCILIIRTHYCRRQWRQWRQWRVHTPMDTLLQTRPCPGNTRPPRPSKSPTWSRKRRKHLSSLVRANKAKTSNNSFRSKQQKAKRARYKFFQYVVEHEIKTGVCTRIN